MIVSWQYNQRINNIKMYTFERTELCDKGILKVLALRCSLSSVGITSRRLKFLRVPRKHDNLISMQNRANYD